MIEFIVFGIIDNLVMIIGAMTGCEVDNWIQEKLPSRLPKNIGTVVGAGIGNATSDWLGGAGAGNFLMANGTALGCIIGLGFIPVVLFIKRKLKNK